MTTKDILRNQMNINNANIRRIKHNIEEMINIAHCRLNETDTRIKEDVPSDIAIYAVKDCAERILNGFDEIRKLTEENNFLKYAIEKGENENA